MKTKLNSNNGLSAAPKRTPAMQRWFAADCIERLRKAKFMRSFKNGDFSLSANGHDWVRRVNEICRQFGFANYHKVVSIAKKAAMVLIIALVTATAANADEPRSKQLIAFDNELVEIIKRNNGLDFQSAIPTPMPRDIKRFLEDLCKFTAHVSASDASPKDKMIAYEWVLGYYELYVLGHEHGCN
jgi:hypothetical protein